LVELTTRSFAKINLFLKVLGKREDNYHEVETLIQIIDLCDIMEFKVTCDDKIKFSSDSPLIDNNDNTVIKALGLLKKQGYVKRGVEVFLKKRIPVGAGLGGGSGNAASALIVMNYLWDLNYSISELREMGKTIGADVPVFLSGSLSYARGRGDEVQEFEGGKFKNVVVVSPGIFISTKEAYESLDSILTKKIYMDKIASSIGFLNNSFESYFNSFEDVVFSRYPELESIKDFLYSEGAEFSQMTGSGSAIFGIFDSAFKYNEICKKVEREMGYKAYPCKYMNFRSSGLFKELSNVSEDQGL
jgi:4-diphosphocytidyl-2-C-methyl-D-erythritol kinase